MKFRAKGKKYTGWLAGKEVMNYESDTAPEKGKIGIQLHGGRVMSIEYRNMKAAPIK